VEREWREVGRSERGGREGRENREGGLSFTTKCSVSNPAHHHLKLEVYSSMNQLQYIAYMK